MQILTLTGNTSWIERIACEDRHHGFKQRYLTLLCRPAMGNELHEPYAVKAARTVLGRGRGGNTSSLFDLK